VDSDNPCLFKKECRRCTLCNVTDRPEACKSLSCEHYTPCKKCGRNLSLFEGKCKICLKSGYVSDLADGESRPEINSVNSVVNDALRSDKQRRDDDRSIEKRAKVRQVKITPPGVSPEEYDESEKKYYKDQWTQYAEYYRDPTIYPLIHNLIILEIELNYITFMMLRTRGEYHDKLIKYRTDIIRNMTSIRDQLPSEESFELSEDEKALSLIYEQYKEEVKKRSKGKIKRLFDLPTIALAPNLYFKKDLHILLTRLGYKEIDVNSAVSKMKDLPEDPFDLAVFLGFPINEDAVQEEGVEQLEDENYSEIEFEA